MWELLFICSLNERVFDDVYVNGSVEMYATMALDPPLNE